MGNGDRRKKESKHGAGQNKTKQTKKEKERKHIMDNADKTEE